MNILLDGYIDRNFGDDMMIRITAHYLKEHTFYIEEPKRELFIPYEKTENIRNLCDEASPVKFDLELTVIGSGFIINGYMGMLRFIKTERARRKRLKGMPRAVIGCNVGPFYNSMAVKAAAWRLKAYKLITVRERNSMNIINDNVKNANCQCFPDIVLGIPDEWIPQIESEGHLGISAYRRLDADNMRCYRVLAKTADEFIERTGKKALLFAFDVEKENDIAAAYTIRDLMSHGESAEIIVHNGDGSNIIRHMKRCGKIVAVRFHMMIMSMRLGLPFVPAAYSAKMKNVLEDIGYNKSVLDINNFDSASLTEALEQAEAVKISSELIEKAREHTKCLRTIMR